MNEDINQEVTRRYMGSPIRGSFVCDDKRLISISDIKIKNTSSPHETLDSFLLGIGSILFVQSPMTRSASGGSLHRHGNRNFQHSFRQQYFCAFTGNFFSYVLYLTFDGYSYWYLQLTGGDRYP
ncbi:hypothetical protein H5410_044714 [Solanum commersonii]|uniref:Uncharacterized protein n=1 Tax=Solanum commersonii TaxID=4109 RepID=A0A9J5XBP0_SOLCO|nr:hypothetical protein H5410_044714 [Solanum commersonii]